MHLGVGRACYEAAISNLEGVEGVAEANIALGLSLLEKGCEAGHPESCFARGLYEARGGEGVEPNLGNASLTFPRSPRKRTSGRLNSNISC